MRHPAIAAAFLLSLLPLPSRGASPLLKVDKDHPIAVSVYPSRSLAPATLRVSIRILRSELNTQMGILISGDYYETQSDSELDVDSPILYIKYYPDLPEGEYTTTAVLVRKDKTFRAQDQALICGMNTCISPEPP